MPCPMVYRIAAANNTNTMSPTASGIFRTSFLPPADNSDTVSGNTWEPAAGRKIPTERAPMRALNIQSTNDLML